MTYVKKSRSKLYFAIILVVILGVAVAAVVYANMTAPKVEVGVKVGDTFTYSLKGTSTLLRRGRSGNSGIFEL